MNQSNKALRDEVADLIDEYRIENNERGLGMLDVEPTADQILSLIAERLPEKKGFLECVNCRRTEDRILAKYRNFNTGRCRHCNGELVDLPLDDYEKGYNQAIDEILALLGEGDKE